MKKIFMLSDEELALFRDSVKGTKQLQQDRFTPSPPKLSNRLAIKKQQQEQADHSFYFSDEYQPLLNSDGPMRYVHPEISHYELKKLRRGDYTPELFLDLHGLTQAQAKQELGALIAACQREHVHCACVMHGHGKHVLKKQTPLWLAQHPLVQAFHQAPKAFGGDAALLILVAQTL